VTVTPVPWDQAAPAQRCEAILYQGWEYTASRAFRGAWRALPEDCTQASAYKAHLQAIDTAYHATHVEGLLEAFRALWRYCEGEER
jgi:hypothetical protein